MCVTCESFFADFKRLEIPHEVCGIGHFTEPDVATVTLLLDRFVNETIFNLIRSWVELQYSFGGIKFVSLGEAPKCRNYMCIFELSPKRKGVVHSPPSEPMPHQVHTHI